MRNILKHTIVMVILVLVLPLSPVVLISPVEAQKTYPRNETVLAYMAGGRRDSARQHNPYLFGWVSDAGDNNLAAERLFYYNPENGTLINWLATGYEMSSDFETLWIYVRSGVTWSDGVEFNATDVAFTYNMLLQPHTPPLGYESAVQEKIDSIEIVDRYSVKFNLKVADPRIVRSSLFSVMIYGSVIIVPEHIWKDVDPTEFNFEPPVYTGPYKLVDFSDAGDRFVWERRDDWWGTNVFGIRPAAKYWIFTAYATEEATALQLASDNLDIVETVSKGTFLSVVNKNPYIRGWYPSAPYASADPCPLYVALNAIRYPWNIRKARIALSYAIDRTALNEISQEGIAQPYPGIFSQYMEPRFKNPFLAKAQQYEALTYDPARTEQIFTSLGWVKGADGMWVTDNGTRVTFELLTPTAWLYIRKEGEQIVDQLRAVGIEAAAKLLAGASYFDAAVRGEWDGLAIWMCGGIDEPYDTLDTLHSKWVVPIGESVAGAHLNPGRWRNSTYDSIVDQMASMSPNDPQYVSLFERSLDIYFQEMPAIGTLTQSYIVPVNFRHWVNWPTSENNYIWSIYFCAQSGLFIALNIKPAEIPTTVVYFTKDTTRFRGIDLVWYGPFKRGDATRLPTDDAEFWIRKGYASYSPLPSEVPPEIPVIARGVESLLESVSGLSTNIATVSASIDTLRQEMGALRGQISMFAAAAAVEGIVIIVLAAVLVLTRRKPSA